MKKIVLTGATGLIGSRIMELLSETIHFIPLSSKQMDITNKDLVQTTLRSFTYDGIIHLAGFTDVDKAETGKERAFSLNETGTKNLIEVAQQGKKMFLYVSTDFVFDGIHPPFFETNKPNPISVYGESKLAGEQVVGQNGMIVRISYPYRSTFERKSDIFRIVKSRLQEKKPLRMITDSTIVPTFIDDIAFAFQQLLLNYTTDIFHVVGKTALSPYELGITIAKLFHLDSSLISQTTYQDFFVGRAKRPQYCEISSKKNTFYQMHTLEEGLSIIKKQLHII